MAPSPRGQPPRAIILAIDKDASARRRIARITRSAGADLILANNAFDAVELVGHHKPALIVLAAELESGSVDAQAIALFRSQHSQSRIIAISSTSDVRLVVRCMRAGAWDVLPKSSMDTALFLAINEAVTNVTQRENQKADNQPTDLGAELDDTGHRVRVLLPQGLTNKQIAARIGVSEKTVERRSKGIRAALGVSSRAEMMLRLGAEKSSDVGTPRDAERKR